MMIRMTKIIISIDTQDVRDLEDAKRIVQNLRLLKDEKTLIEIWDGKKLILRTYGLKPS